MNAGPADTRSPHLDLGDLIAEVTGQPIDDRAREHLARCAHCRAELTRWNLVAGGVRGLADATPEAAQPTGAQSSRSGFLAGHRRRTILVASAAAAVVILGAIGYGAASSLARHPSGAVLTSVSGCSSLEQASGTLEQVTGSSLVLKTAAGQPLTVTTTTSTLVNMSGPLRSDITDGAAVDVRGSRSGGTIAAAIVTVGQPFSDVNPAGYVPVPGTVADATSSGFTLVTSGGTRIPVTTSASTLVIVPHASLSQLQDGTTIFALGHAGPGGTLTAQAVAAITQPPTGGHLNVAYHGRGCSPSAIAEALGAGA
jgi:hypothetical protein